LAADTETQYYITISARVAADLPANDFWERVGFRCIRTEVWGATTGRRINVRRYSRTVRVTVSNRRIRTRTYGGVAGVDG
jgi:hypothetical protein